MISCLLVSLLVLALLPVTIFASGEQNVKTYQELADAITKGGTVNVISDITLEEPLVIEKDVTLTGSATMQLSSSWSETAASPITVEKNATFTLDGVCFDGKQATLAYGEHSAALFDVIGTMIVADGKIQNFISTSTSSNSHLLFIDGGSFVMNGGTISDNVLKTGYYHGIIGLENGGTFTMNGGMINKNQVADSQGASGVVYVSNYGGENTFIMEGGEIAENLSCAVYVGSNSSNASVNGKGIMTLNDGMIRNNDSGESFYAGGIYIVNGEVTMNGGTVKENTGKYYGGGIALVANPEATLIMNGGSIIQNRSMYGAGIFITGINNTDWKADVQLNAGLIAENEVSRQGGGIYVVKGQEVQLRNAAIYENAASIIGGGIWTCSTGNLKTYITNGGAVFDNMAAGAEDGSAGDDLAFVQHKDSEPEFFIAQRALGGGQIHYYEDGGVYVEEDNGGEGTDGTSAYYLGTADGSARYDADQPGKAISSIDLLSGSYALKSVISENAKSLSKEKAQLLITQNKANRGAGIGANGSVIIGDAPNTGEETTEYTLEVTKKWSADVPASAKQEIEAALVCDGYTLDSVTLSKENNWTAAFTGLPKGNYTVKELNVPDDMQSIVSETTLNEETATYQVQVTNEMLPVNVTVEKIWKDENDKNGIRPETVTVHLYADGTEAKQAVLSAQNDWTWVFDALPAYKNGQLISYTITEDAVSGYTTEITGNMDKGFTITNTYVPVSTGEEQEEDHTSPNKDAAEEEDVHTSSSSVTSLWMLLASVSLVGFAATLTKRRLNK